jgi:hypothetical protein
MSIIPDGFFKEIAESVKTLDEAQETTRKEEQKKQAERQESEQKETEIWRKREERLYPQTLQQSKEVFDWIRRFYEELEPEKLSLLKKIFSDHWELFGLWVYWDHPTWLYWNRYGRKFMYGPIELRVASNPEELSREGGSDFVTKFHNYLYGGEVWKDLESKMAAGLDGLKKGGLRR